MVGVKIALCRSSVNSREDTIMVWLLELYLNFKRDAMIDLDIEDELALKLRVLINSKYLQIIRGDMWQRSPIIYNFS